MNCKPGDLAIHKGGLAGINSKNLGKILRLGRFIGAVDGLDGADRFEIVDGGPLVTNHGDFINTARDIYLQTIRPNDGQDETLTWAGKPEQVTA